MAHPSGPLVSVILPVYNAEDTLSGALESLHRQRFGDYEVVVIDDGSTDATADVIDQHAARNARLRVLSPGRHGLIPSLNAGIAAASGQYIARMDADDIAHPDRLGLQAAHLQEHRDITLVGSLVRCFPRQHVGEGFRVYEDWLNSLVSPGDIARDIYIESPIVHPSIMARRQDLAQVGLYQDRGWAEDYDLWLRLHLAGKRFSKVTRTLHFWRESPYRLTRVDGRYSVENFLRCKAHYLAKGPLASDARAILWGAGQIGRRLSKHLQRAGVELVAFVDIDPRKIGNTRRGAPIVSPVTLPQLWEDTRRPTILAAVPSRDARSIIRDRLADMGMRETTHFLCVA